MILKSPPVTPLVHRILTVADVHMYVVWKIPGYDLSHDSNKYHVSISSLMSERIIKTNFGRKFARLFDLRR